MLADNYQKRAEIPFQGIAKLANVQFPVGMGEVLTGTTIMATVFGEPDEKGAYPGVIIGADSRTSTGTYVANRVTDKLTKITDHIYACRSGSAADTQAIVDIVQYYLRVLEVEQGHPPLVETAARLCKQFCYDYKDKFLAGLIVAGWDPVKGGQVYSIPLGGTLVQQDWSIGGSGSTFIWGFCDEHFQNGFSDMEAIGFVRRAIGHAVNRDGSSGGVCRTACITSAGVDRLVFNLDTKEDIHAVEGYN